MSTQVSYLVDDAAQAIGDPNKQRVQLSQWLSIYNRSNRELCEKANVLKFRDKFTLVPGQIDYDYPEGMVVMSAIHVSETPADDSTFRVINEYREDEFREMTSGAYPSATLPSGYFADSNWFYLVPMVDVQIVDGGCITYFGLPDRVLDLNGVMQADDLAQDYLLRRMIIHGLTSRNRRAEADDELKLWLADMESLQDKLEDRSIDRRSSIAPRRRGYSGMR